MNKTVTLLVGPQGSGKTGYCQEHLADHLRFSQDEQGKQGHLQAFEEALARSEMRIVVDRINALKFQRRRYLELARRHEYRTRIIWLNVDRAVCLRRCRERTGHPTLEPGDAEKALEIYFKQFQTPSKLEADELVILGNQPEYVKVVDLRGHIGSRRYIILGDVHGCYDEMREMLESLAYVPDQDVLISVGDIIDRGPKIRETVEYLLSQPDFHMVLGNHEHKLIRYLEGRQVKVGAGLQTTIDSFDHQIPTSVVDRLSNLPLILRVADGYVVHAGFDPEMSPEEQSQADCIYMRYYGGKTYFDEINGKVWHSIWPKDGPRVYFGHIPDPAGPFLNHVISLDAGCVFGGELKAYDSRDGKVHAVKARQPYTHHQYGAADRPPVAETLRKLEEYVVAGLLRGDRTDDGRLAVYTYTDACTFDSAWDDVTRNARGHIYDLQTGECLAWPFPKFFNLGENQEVLPERFPWDQPYEIYEKMDGWLGVLYRHEGRFKVATRGSFHSTGAVWATEFIQNLDFWSLPVEATLCFEIIHPDHQIILNYKGERTLIVLAAFNRFTREEYPRAVVAEWAKNIGLPLVPLLGRMSLEDLLGHQKDRQNIEGFVIRFHDGRRVKVKTAWYLQMAKIMTNLTPIAVWEVMERGKVKPSYLQQVPEELQPLAEKYQAVLEGQYAQLLLDIEHRAGPILQQHGSDRRALAKYLDQHKKELGFIRSAVFILLDGKRDKLENVIMDQIYPRANRFAKLALCGQASDEQT